MVLSKEQRATILKDVSSRVYEARTIASALIGSDGDLYRGLLEDSSRKDLHSRPYTAHRMPPGENWRLWRWKAGFRRTTWRFAQFCETYSGWGPQAARCEEQVNSWMVLENHADSRIRGVASIGRKMAEDATTKYRKEDKSEAVFEAYGR